MSKKTIIFFLILFTLLSFALHIYKSNKVPLCINADEASFGYNAYSLLKTGKDEYGAFLPLRLKSFGDYKLPLYSYLSIPFIGIFGLNEFSTRLLSYLVGILFPLLIYFLSKELFNNKKIALISAFLMSVSPWMNTLSRQAHEASLAAFFITLTCIFFLRFIKNRTFSNCLLFSLCNGLSLFSYHISRTYAFFFFCALIIFLIANRKKISIRQHALFFFIFLAPLLIFLLSELRYPATRVQNLIFYRDIGFSLKTNELRGEHDIRALHNKLTTGIIHIVNEYSKYFSPQFLVISGDFNVRFGYKGISPITLIEYLFFLIGLYYLFALKEKKRYFVIVLLLIAPLTASLAWQEYSLTRSFYLIVPLILIIGYGIKMYFVSLKKNRYSKLFTGIIIIAYMSLLFMSWDFYFFHYPKRPLVIQAFQCGYKELAEYVRINYDRFSEFKITPRHGQPYIFLLYYLRFDPNKYQRVAHLSPPDEYGFGQVEKFDTFDFNFSFDEQKKGISYIGYPENFIDNPHIDQTKVKKIRIGGVDTFWIYENP